MKKTLGTLAVAAALSIPVVAQYPYPDRDHDRDYDRDRGYSHHYYARDYQRRFSAADQRRFDKAYDHWLHERREGDRHALAKPENEMQAIMARYNIPRDVPYERLVSRGRGYY